MTQALKPLPGVTAAVCAVFPELIAIPQLVEKISVFLDYSTLWSLKNASSVGDLRLVKRVAAHVERRLQVMDLPRLDVAVHASFIGSVAEAADKGHLTIFQWLVTHYASKKWDVTDAIVRASRHGHLNVLKWAQRHKEIATFRWSNKIMVVAAIEGNFNVVRWLHEHSSAPGSSYVMDCAAGALDLPMLEWLHANRTEGCTPYAMDNAARKGSLEIVQWLHTHRTEGCTTGAMDGAAMNGHLHVLQWLHRNRQEGCTASALHCAAVNGHANVVRWLNESVPVGDRRRAFASAVRWGHLDVVKILAKDCCVSAGLGVAREFTALRQRTEAEMRVPTSSLQQNERSQRILARPPEEIAIWYGHLRVLQFLFSNGFVSENGRSRVEMAATATARGHARVAKWLLTSPTDPSTCQICRGQA